MLKSLLWTLAGFVTAGGGLWVAALFIPSVAAVVSSTLRFLSSPFGMVCGAIVAALVIYGAGWVGGDIHGTGKTRAAWIAANVVADRKAAARDASIDVIARAGVDKEIAAEDRETAALNRKVSDYEKMLSYTPTAVAPASARSSSVAPSTSCRRFRAAPGPTARSRSRPVIMRRALRRLPRCSTCVPPS